MIHEVKKGEMFSLTRVPAVAFFNESKIDGVLDFPHFCDWWDNAIGMRIGVVLVNENNGVFNGIIGGLISQCMMTKDIIATECFWWIAPELRDRSPAGIKLLLRWEEIVKERYAKRIYVGNLHAVNHDKMQDLYHRLGYKSLETHYVKNT
jgi:hypothetical protein